MMSQLSTQAVENSRFSLKNTAATAFAAARQILRESSLFFSR